jgi:transposase-like protein
MAKRPPKQGERTVRRAAQRAQTKLENDRDRLFLLEPGGSAERPLEAHSAAVIETQATSVPCPRCGGSQEVVEHAALVHGGVRLRQVKLRCRKCGSKRSLWFRLVGPSLN